MSLSDIIFLAVYTGIEPVPLGLEPIVLTIDTNRPNHSIMYHTSEGLSSKIIALLSRTFHKSGNMQFCGASVNIGAMCTS